ncbi:hypothetical protein PGT21_001441 [Puccinia graminis f. sp. tritici]|uniref:Uncharacterized protein n=1 Tax=Puccinia graminis f. sp. tritici TaxID=56615 RepID=A0A5B0NJJ8_PUCGR|nr:hypothetical protein PGT21_001441 [Puccinia graminis f. sp. tritici]
MLVLFISRTLNLRLVVFLCPFIKIFDTPLTIVSQDRVSPVVLRSCPTGEHRLQSCNIQCVDCGALHWPEERAVIDIKAKKNKFSICCQKGNVVLPCASLSAPQIPRFLQDLFIGTTRGEYLTLHDFTDLIN